MTEKRTINSKVLIHDIKSGMSDSELTRKFGVSSAGLASAFKKLLDAGLVTEEELGNRPVKDDDSVAIDLSDLEV